MEISRDFYWVGAIDWNVRLFHDFLSTSTGSTYNAYIAIDEKITLFDTVYRPFKEELIENISAIVAPSDINYIVVNHVEMDHSGSLPHIMEIVKPEKLFCSKMGKKALIEHFHREDWPYEVVEDGQEISIGKKSIRFIESRMLHWPDSMLSYIKEDGILISNDIFGQHIATPERFVDENDLSYIMRQAKKYYANIFMPYSKIMAKLLSSIKGMDIEIIAPDHGLIWRGKDVKEIFDAYVNWSENKTENKALIIYDTMYHSTEKMAKYIYSGIREEGIKHVKIINLGVEHRSDIMIDLLDAKAIILGSATLNNGLLPNMADFLSYLKGLRPEKKIGMAFGSYGWSGEALNILNREMEEMKIKVIDPGLRVEYVPTQKDLERCVELGRKIGRAIKDTN